MTYPRNLFNMLYHICWMQSRNSIVHTLKTFPDCGREAFLADFRHKIRCKVPCKFLCAAGSPPASRLPLRMRRRYSPKVRKTFDCPPGRTMTRGFCSTTVLSAGTLSVTTQFAPMRTLSPTVTPPMIFAPAPI